MQEQMMSNKNNKAEKQVQSTKATEKHWQKVIRQLSNHDKNLKQSN